jgi:hypothetical protein
MKIAPNFSFLYLIRKNAASNSKCPIYCRVTINGQRTEIALGINVEEKTFNKSAGLIKGSTKEAQAINAQLDEARNRLRKIYNDLSEKNEAVSAEMVREAFAGKKTNQKTLLELITWHNEMFAQKVKSGVRAQASLLKFNTTKSKLQAFIKYQYKTNDIPLLNLRSSFAEGFEHYLTVVDNLEYNTVMKHIRNVKKLMIMAEQKEWIPKNPIAAFKCGYKHPERSILLQSDIDKLINTKFEIIRLEEVTDCFLILCYTGFAYYDAVSL